MINNKDVVRIMQISEATSGGVYTHLTQLATHINQKSFEQVFILSSQKNKDLLEQDEFYGNELIIVDIDSKIKLFNYFQAARKIRKQIRIYQPDIVHCHSSKGGIVGRLASLLLKDIKLVYTPHAFAIHAENGKFKNFFFSLIERLLAFITTKIICVSYGERATAIDNAVCHSEKLHVILNGIEERVCESSTSKEEWLQTYGFTGHEKIVGFLGRLADQKDPLTFIEISKKFKCDKKVVFVMIGDGPLDEIVRQEAGENCLVIGHHIRPREITRYFDLYVMTSLWEGLPYTLLESMYDEIPTIATDISGVNEIICHNETGLLGQVRDVDHLSRQVEYLLNNSDEAIRLSKKAKELINKNYKLTKMIKETEKLYSEL